MGGTLLVHALLVAFLFLMSFSVPKPQAESGVPVLLGDAWNASKGDASDLVEVDVMPQIEPVEQIQEDFSQEFITQTEEETVTISSEARTAEDKTVEHENAVSEAVNRLREQAELERKQKEAEELARRRVEDAFGKGIQMGEEGNEVESSIQGSKDGFSQTGKVEGIGGYGTFDLGGRSLKGSLPIPAYNVQEEGRVVVSIVVNPSGQVISTNINKKTNTVNPILRKAAEDAAKKALFNSVEGLNNQQGTITYYFNLK